MQIQTNGIWKSNGGFMIELNSEYPDKESIKDGFTRIMANIREDLSDMELLMRRVIDGRTYMTKEEVAAMLKCGEDELPQKLVKYHVGRNYLYKLSDIFEFVESRRLGGKK